MNGRPGRDTDVGPPKTPPGKHPAETPEEDRDVLDVWEEALPNSERIARFLRKRDRDRRGIDPPGEGPRTTLGDRRVQS